MLLRRSIKAPDGVAGSRRPRPARAVVVEAAAQCLERGDDSGLGHLGPGQAVGVVQGLLASVARVGRQRWRTRQTHMCMCGEGIGASCAYKRQFSIPLKQRTREPAMAMFHGPIICETQPLSHGTPCQMGQWSRPTTLCSLIPFVRQPLARSIDDGRSDHPGRRASAGACSCLLKLSDLSLLCWPSWDCSWQCMLSSFPFHLSLSTCRKLPRTNRTFSPPQPFFFFLVSN